MDTLFGSTGTPHASDFDYLLSIKSK
jgi:hypothetical protein